MINWTFEHKSIELWRDWVVREMLCGDLKANYICHANWWSLPCAFRSVSSRDYVKDFNTLHETANVCDIKILNRIIHNPSKLYVIKLAVYFHSYEKIRLFFQFTMYANKQWLQTQNVTTFLFSRISGITYIKCTLDCQITTKALLVMFAIYYSYCRFSCDIAIFQNLHVNCLSVYGFSFIRL